MTDSEHNYDEEIKRLQGQVDALQTVLMEVWTRMLSEKPVDLSTEREALAGVTACQLPISPAPEYWRSYNSAILPFQNAVTRHSE